MGRKKQLLVFSIMTRCNYALSQNFHIGEKLFFSQMISQYCPDPGKRKYVVNCWSQKQRFKWGGWEKLNNVHSKFFNEIFIDKETHLKNRKNENNAATFNENLNIKRNDFRSIYFDIVYTYWMDFSLCW